jgi:excisionase family DNA binding protein
MFGGNMNSVRVESANRMLRVHTLARLLGCSTRTIRRRIQNEEIPAVRIGRRAWGVRASDLGRPPGNPGGGHVGD